SPSPDVDDDSDGSTSSPSSSPDQEGCGEESTDDLSIPSPSTASSILPASDTSTVSAASAVADASVVTRALESRLALSPEEWDAETLRLSPGGLLASHLLAHMGFPLRSYICHFIEKSNTCCFSVRTGFRAAGCLVAYGVASDATNYIAVT